MPGTLPIFVLMACSGSRDNQTGAADTLGSVVSTQNSLTDNSPVGNASVAPATAAPGPGATAMVPLAAQQSAAPPARDAEQDFLRHMLDHHETVLAIVHSQMMEPAGHDAHGKKTDPVAWDAKLDVEKREMLALLKKHYKEDYSPRLLPATATAGVSSNMGQMPMRQGTATSEQEAEKMMRVEALLTAQLRKGARLADRFAPKLKRREVRDLARRMRALQLELAGELGTQMRKP